VTASKVAPVSSLRQKRASRLHFANCRYEVATPGASIFWREPVAAAPRLRSAGSLRRAPLRQRCAAASTPLAFFARAGPRFAAYAPASAHMT